MELRWDPEQETLPKRDAAEEALVPARLRQLVQQAEIAAQRARVVVRPRASFEVGEVPHRGVIAYDHVAEVDGSSRVSLVVEHGRHT